MTYIGISHRGTLGPVYILAYPLTQRMCLPTQALRTTTTTIMTPTSGDGVFSRLTVALGAIYT